LARQLNHLFGLLALIGAFMNAIYRTLHVRLGNEPVDAWLSRWGCAFGALALPGSALAVLATQAASELEFALGAAAAALASLLLFLLGNLARHVHLATTAGRAPWRARRGELLSHAAGVAIVALAGQAVFSTPQGTSTAVVGSLFVLAAYAGVLCLGCWSTVLRCRPESDPADTRSAGEAFEVRIPALTSLAIVLTTANASAAEEPAYMIRVTQNQRIRATNTFVMSYPKAVAEEWIILAWCAPELPCQADVSSELTPNGKRSAEIGDRRRPVLVARVKVTDEKRKSAITYRVEYQAVLQARELVELPPGAERPSITPLQMSERMAYLASTATQYDFDRKEFQQWLDANKLRQDKGESAIAFARRAFRFIRRNFRYEHREGRDLRASAVCEAGKSSCGGMSHLFVATMRANGIPARSLVGKWAQSMKPGERVGDDPYPYAQQHVKAEFHAQGVGWVPVDMSLALDDMSVDGLTYFGKDAGSFLVFQVDYGLTIDTGPFGKHKFDSLWFACWPRGTGDTGERKQQENWQVEVMGNTRETFTDVAQRLVKAMNAGDYEAVRKAFNEEMRQAFPVDKCKDFCRDIVHTHGKINKLEPLQFKSVVAAVFVARCEHGALNFTLTLDKQGRVAGLLFEPVPNAPVPPKNQSKLRLPFNEAWLVMGGGDTAELNFQHHGDPVQNFAFDLVGVDADGKTHKENASRNEDYQAFGREVLAPADGLATEVIEGVRDNVPGSMNPLSALGNAVFIQHSKSEVSVLAHLKQGSTRVRAGDKVTKGQVIGLCGNSGNSSEPHLHYHLQNTPVIQDATGIKCFFEEVGVEKEGAKTIHQGYSPVKGDIISPAKKK
jgi:transglutaminase-like putative cysteine protease